MKKIVLAIVTVTTLIVSRAQTSPVPLTYFRLPNKAMAPAIPKDALIVIDPFGEELVRGDIISYTEKESKGRYVKRVVAVPGDHIENTSLGLKINGKLQLGLIQNETLESSAISEDEKFPSIGQAGIVRPGRLYVAFDSPMEMLNSQTHGSINRAQVEGKAYLWSDVLKIEGWPKVFLSRNIASIQNILPIEIEWDFKGFVWEDFSVKGDRALHLSFRLNREMAIDERKTILEQFVKMYLTSYCVGQFGPKWFGIDESFSVISNSSQSILEFGFSPESCHSPRM